MTSWAASKTTRGRCNSDPEQTSLPRKARAPLKEIVMNRIIYIVGLVVIVLFILGFLGLR
jgi:hypothetical protein